MSELSIGFPQLLVLFIYPLMGFFGWYIRQLAKKVDNAIDEAQVRQILSDKLEIYTSQIQALVQRLSHIENKLDKLLELYVNSKKKS